MTDKEPATDFSEKYGCFGRYMEPKTEWEDKCHCSSRCSRRHECYKQRWENKETK